MEASMRKKRTSVMPEQATTLQHYGELLSDPRYTARFATTKNGKQYFAACYTGDAAEGTVVVFISSNLKHLLGTANEFHLDGHFKMTPALTDVYQIMTIMPVAFDHTSI
jgi:hypothetical protein